MSWRSHVPQVWTQSQRAVLIAFLLLMSIYLALRLHRDSATLRENLPAVGPRAAELMDRVDLNAVDAVTLSVVPHLGEKKARDIIAYRDGYVAAHAGHRAFDRLEDLYHIKGIGLATLEQLRPYVFIADQAATKP